MLASVHSGALVGLDAQPVDVEIDIAGGLERVTLVGLPDTAVRESSERVRAALGNSGYIYPAHRLTVNLAPADLRKEGAGRSWIGYFAGTQILSTAGCSGRRVRHAPA